MMNTPSRIIAKQTETGILVLTFTEPLLTAAVVLEARAILDTTKQLKVILDCQFVRFLVSGSLFPDREPFTPLLKLSQQMAEAGGRLVLCNTSPEFTEVLRVTRFDQIWEVRTDLHAAMACLETAR
jgi:STAS domain